MTHADDEALAAALETLGSRPGESAVLCDLDGTLCPIVPRPEDVAVPAGALSALVAIRRRYALLGFVSGRARAELERIVALGACAYAGNHGMEIRHPGGAAGWAPDVDGEPGALGELVTALGAAMRAQGIGIEDKGLTLSLHYRTARNPDAARAFLTTHVAPAAGALGLRTREGRMVLEVLPRHEATKGTAVRALISRAGVRRAVYLGDDRTDLDAFATLRDLAAEGALDRALCIVSAGPEVDPDVHAAGDLAVDGPAGVQRALEILAERPRGADTIAGERAWRS